jgi:3-methylcrotonyl-CoA carboxylase alpha subunit
MITGLDLVEWQLRVAAGEPLPLLQEKLRPRGHAIEARLYAEDPRKGFLPSIGKLECLRLSTEGDGVRVDTGVRESDSVGIHYDPMIAKVIAWDGTREGAAAKLAHALAATKIAGVQTNTGLLVRALKHPEFVAGEIDTGFIERHQHELVCMQPAPEIFACAALFAIEERKRGGVAVDPWDSNDGFRLFGEARETLEFSCDASRGKVIAVHHRDGGVSLAIEGAPVSPPLHSSALRLSSGAIAVISEGETWTLIPRDPFADAESSGAVSDRIVAPMPGKIVRVLARAQESVKRGQPLVVLEAMKMEHTLSAPADARIESIDAAVGDQVSDGAVLVRFAEKKAAA